MTVKPMHKPYSESCDQNRDPILQVIQPVLAQRRSVLEIGSGTGQHAVYFAERMPHLHWHCSDRAEYLPGISMWLKEAALPNTPMPICLDVTDQDWPTLEIDVVYSANTCHIMHWHEVVALFTGVGHALPVAGDFLLYGPFNYDGQYTSDSNARFDEFLKTRDSGSGLRDVEALSELANRNAMTLVQDVAMPANNRMLRWRKNLA